MSVPYEIGDLLGAGGTAAVFRAWDAAGRPVALRILHAHLATDPRAVARFLDEATATAGLRHRHLATTLDSGRSGSVVWAATDAVDGITVAELAELSGPLPVADALRVVIGVLDGLAYAHEHGLVHLDLSAANVMVPAASGEPDLDRAVVLDIGRRAGGAADSGSSRSVVGAPDESVVRVSPHFAAPEVASAGPAGPPADVYSVGCLLHLLLTGRPPFLAPTPREVLEHQVSTPPPRPSTLRVGVSQSLDGLVLAALAKRPDGRPDVASLGVLLRGELAAVGGNPSRRSGASQGVPASTPRLTAVPGAPPVDLGCPPAPTALPRASGRAGRWRALGVLGVLGALVAAGVTAAAGQDVPPREEPIGAGAGEIASDALSWPTATTTDPTVATSTVPDVAGLAVDAAAAALGDVGLAPDVAVQDEPAPEGTVASQEPAAGSEVAPGSTVRLVVASGYVVVPDLAGGAPADASLVLGGLGFDVRTVDVGAATVGSTTPAAGRRVPFGATVLLLPPLGTPTVLPEPSERASLGPAGTPGPSPTATTGPTAGPITSPGPAPEPTAPAAPTTPVPTSTPVPTGPGATAAAPPLSPGATR